MKKDKLKKYPLNLNGSMWLAEEGDFEEVENHHIIFRSEKGIVVQCDGFDNDGVLWKYTLTLTQLNGRYYSGKWEAKTGNGKTDEGTADCILYWNEKGYLLYGRWVEDGDDYRWFAELNFKNQK